MKEKEQEIKCSKCGFTVWSYDPNFEHYRKHIGWKKSKDEKWKCSSCASVKENLK